jgi:hypothetical protein
MHALFERIRPFEEYGCQINALSIPELFARYHALGFLYPEKLQRLAPYLEIIQENWRRVMEAGDDLMWLVTHDDPDGGFATVSTWRSTNTGWLSQHLISNHPVASGRVLLGAQARIIQKGYMRSQQNWFRPTNRYARRVFGSIGDVLGEEQAAVQAFAYLAVLSQPLCAPPTTLHVVRCSDTRKEGLYDLAVRARGRVYAEAEELHQDDLELAALDERYRRVGLSRRRAVWMAQDPAREQPIAAAIAYRGPLGLNFSMIENRCDILVDPGLDLEETCAAIAALVPAVASAYSGFAPGFIPVTATGLAADALASQGAREIEVYCQSIWLESAFEAWYHHVASLYKSRLDRLQRRLEGMSSGHHLSSSL